jgi:hypothetical protein
VGDFSKLDGIYRFQCIDFEVLILFVFPGYFLIYLEIPWDFFGFSQHSEILLKLVRLYFGNI